MPTRREFIKQVPVAAGVGAAVMGLGLSPARVLAASDVTGWVLGEVTEERLAQIRGAAETLLSNPVIEDYSVSEPQQ